MIGSLCGFPLNIFRSEHSSNRLKHIGILLEDGDPGLHEKNLDVCLGTGVKDLDIHQLDWCSQNLQELLRGYLHPQPRKFILPKSQTRSRPFRSEISEPSRHEPVPRRTWSTLQGVKKPLHQSWPLSTHDRL